MSYNALNFKTINKNATLFNCSLFRIFINLDSIFFPFQIMVFNRITLRISFQWKQITGTVALNGAIVRPDLLKTNLNWRILWPTSYMACQTWKLCETNDPQYRTFVFRNAELWKGIWVDHLECNTCIKIRNCLSSWK